MKKCPFSGKACGDWCQLFVNDRCIFQSLDTWLSMIMGNIEDLKEIQEAVKKKMPG